MKTKGRQPVMLRLLTARGSCVGKSIHSLQVLSGIAVLFKLRQKLFSEGLSEGKASVAAVGGLLCMWEPPSY